MKERIKTWLDPDGLLHLDKFPRVDSTINAPMYTGLYICLLYANGKLTTNDIGDFLYGISHLYKDKQWRTHSASTIDRFAHDNFTGVICGLVCCRKKLESLGYATREIDLWVNRIPFYHQNADHPRDFIFYNYVKRPWLFFWLLPIVSIAMIVTCYDSDKIRHGKRIIKTDGKILSFMRWTAVKMPITQFICEYLFENRVHTRNDGVKFVWKNIFNIVCDYFKNASHPNRNEAYIYSYKEESL